MGPLSGLSGDGMRAFAARARAKIRRMRAFLALCLAASSASAAPDPAALVRSALPEGFALPVGAFEERIPAPAARETELPSLRQAPNPLLTEISLAPLLDKHWTAVDSYDAGGVGVRLATTLDLAGDGYLAVTTPEFGETTFYKIQRGMSGRWTANGRTYSVSLSVSIFRARLSNYIVIKDASGRTVWEKRIIDLLQATYRQGLPVTAAGRPYRFFYSRLPSGDRPSVDTGLCFIYDDTSNGGHDYKFYLIPISQVIGTVPTSYKMFGGGTVRLRVSPDQSVLEITP